MLRQRPKPALGGRPVSPARQRAGRRALLVGLAPVLVVALTGCAVEAVTGDVADQQLCVAAQPVVDAVGARGKGPGEVGGVPDLRELAARARDAELRRVLTQVGEAYADASRDGPDSTSWTDAERAVGTLDRVCRRLSAF